jgi:hypothetical protein
MLLTFCDDPDRTLKTSLPMKDPSKPDGEAVNADGTLKAADQIKWLNSPTDESIQANQGPNEDGGDAAESDENREMQDSDSEAKRSGVSYYERHGHNTTVTCQ